MPSTTVKRQTNPKLGAYFAIFSAAYVALVLLALIGDNLGGSSDAARWAVLVAPCLLYAVIGLASSSSKSLEYFAVGRRVPAVYSGFALSLPAFGGTGLVAITGALFLVGFDALCLVIGGLAGFVVMGILLAPFMRKFGAYTTATYLGARFDSRRLRVTSAIVIAVPLTLMLVAELKMATLAGHFLTGASDAALLSALAITLATLLLGGGTRAMTWTCVAQTIATLLAIVVPAAIVALMWTNLPLPQLSYGPAMRGLARNESLQGLPIILAQGLTFDMPGNGLSAIAKRFATTFCVVSPSGFVAATLTVMAGVAAAPWLLPRIAAAPGVYEARKSVGWATVIFGLLMLTAASIAVFLRVILLENITEFAAAPDWLRKLALAGYAEVDAKIIPGALDQARGALGSIAMMRDVALFALPAAAGLTATFTALTVAGAIAAALAGASAACVALAATVSEDIVHGQAVEPPPDEERLLAARVALLGVIVVASVLAWMVPADSLDLLLWALALSGSALFPVQVLSIWWKRINEQGAFAGILGGLATALLAMAGNGLGLFDLDPALAGVFAIPTSFAVAIATSLATLPPGKHERELLRDIRVPGGEILYDREMRLLRLKKRERKSAPV